MPGAAMGGRRTPYRGPVVAATPCDRGARGGAAATSAAAAATTTVATTRGSTILGKLLTKGAHL